MRHRQPEERHREVCGWPMVRHRGNREVKIGRASWRREKTDTETCFGSCSNKQRFGGNVFRIFTVISWTGQTRCLLDLMDSLWKLPGQTAAEASLISWPPLFTDFCNWSSASVMCEGQAICWSQTVTSSSNPMNGLKTKLPVSNYTVINTQVAAGSKAVHVSPPLCSVDQPVVAIDPSWYFLCTCVQLLTLASVVKHL